MKKVVLITGASSGMGKEAAKLLARNNYVVYAAARRTEKMKDLEVLGIKTMAMDVADDSSMVKGVDQILSREKRIDILINNAGFGAYGSVEEVSMETAKYQLEVNLFGAARLIQLVLPIMRKNRFGKILNITSVGGKLATPYGGWYHASKFALEGLSDSLRNEVKQFGIDVIVIEPGAVESEWADIAMDNLAGNSRKSPYKDAIDKMARSLKTTMDKRSKQIVIADLIKKSIETNRPKARYSGGFMAKPTLFFKWLLSDRLFDKMLASQMK